MGSKKAGTEYQREEASFQRKKKGNNGGSKTSEKRKVWLEVKVSGQTDAKAGNREINLRVGQGRIGATFTKVAYVY